MSHGATEIAIADLRDPESLDRAVRGVDGVFHIAPAFEVDESQMGLNMLRAACGMQGCGGLCFLR